MTAIEQDIKDILDEISCGKYIGKLKVVQETVPDTESTIWMLLLYLDMEITPMILAYEGTEEQFKDFVTKELKARKLHGVHFWKTLQEFPGEINDNHE